MFSESGARDLCGANGVDRCRHLVDFDSRTGRRSGRGRVDINPAHVSRGCSCGRPSRTSGGGRLGAARRRSHDLDGRQHLAVSRRGLRLSTVNTGNQANRDRPDQKETRPHPVHPIPPGRLARSLYSLFMGKFDGTRMYRLRPCLTALRVLAISANPNRYLLVERHIDEYLRTHHSLAHALEALRRAIHHEEVQGHAEYWSIVQEYVRSLLRRMNG